MTFLRGGQFQVNNRASVGRKKVKVVGLLDVGLLQGFYMVDTFLRGVCRFAIGR